MAETAQQKRDYLAGVRIEGQWENDRNAASHDLFKSILQECFGQGDCIIGHHLICVRTVKGADGFEYNVTEEFPSADALILDHSIMRKVFGDNFRNVIIKLACEPVESRDAMLAEFYYSRKVTV